MRTVDINYRKYFRNKVMHINVPEKWEDLKPYQFEVCAQMHVSPPDDDEFIQRFFKISARIVKQLTKFEKYKLTEMVGFAIHPSGITDTFYIQEISGTGLLSPTRRLGNITLEHFALMDTYFFKYVNNPTQLALSEFVSALYLKRKEVLTEIDFTKRAAYVAANVDQYTQYALFLNYLFIRKWLSMSFKFLFSDETEDEPTNRKFKRPKSSVNNLPRWIDIIENFVGEDILNYDKYTAINCIRAFKVMNNRIKIYNKNAK